MKNPLLLCLVLLGSATVQAAPGRDETIAYINATCADGNYYGNSTRLEKVAIGKADTAIVSLHTETMVPAPPGQQVLVFHNVTTFDLRKVEIRLQEAFQNPDGTTSPARVAFRCSGSCISVTTRTEDWQNSALVRPPTTETVTGGGEDLFCPYTDRVFRAFQRLQELAGGQKKDPFAN